MVRPTCVTQVVGYYDQPQMLAVQARHLTGWPGALRKRWRLIVVDDGSPNAPAPPAPAYELYRVHRDVPWNVEGARNIGVHEATTDWLLVTDIDHIVPRETAQALLAGEWSERICYSFTRRLPDGAPFRPHCNSFFLSRRLWDRIGGCDERLSGHYGGSNEWLGRARAVADAVKELALPLVMYRPEDIPDAWADLTRRYEGDTAIRRELRQRIRKAPGPVTLSFAYERVA